VGIGYTHFIVTLLLCFNQLDLKKYRPQLLMGFALGCTATILYLYADAFVTIRHYGLPLSSILSPAFTNHNFSEPIYIHATFFSLQIAMALIYLLSRLIGERLTFTNQLLYGILLFGALGGCYSIKFEIHFCGFAPDH